MARFTRSEDDFRRSTRQPSEDIARATERGQSSSGLGDIFEAPTRSDEELRQREGETLRGRQAVEDVFAAPLTEGARQGLARKPSPEQIARGAQEALESTEFFDYTPTPFMPYSDDHMRAVLHDVGLEMIDRQLRPEEMDRVMQRARRAEVRFWHSRQRVEEAKAATGFVSDAPTNEAAMIDAVATKILQEDPDLGNLSAAELTERAEIARQEARKKFEEDFAEAERMASETFTPFREEDFQLAMQEAIGEAAPFEALGTEMRDAMEGLMGAIAGQVNPRGFVPR